MLQRAIIGDSKLNDEAVQIKQQRLRQEKEREKGYKREKSNFLGSNLQKRPSPMGARKRGGDDTNG